MASTIYSFDVRPEELEEEKEKGKGKGKGGRKGHQWNNGHQGIYLHCTPSSASTKEGRGAGRKRGRIRGRTGINDTFRASDKNGKQGQVWLLFLS